MSGPQGSFGLAEVLEEARTLLGVTDLGADDDLFQLGLDSLTAGVLLGALNDEFGWQLDLVSIFDAPSIRGLFLLGNGGNSVGGGSEGEA